MQYFCGLLFHDIVEQEERECILKRKRRAELLAERCLQCLKVIEAPCGKIEFEGDLAWPWHDAEMLAQRLNRMTVKVRLLERPKFDKFWKCLKRERSVRMKA